jgi:hypothetical protein
MATAADPVVAEVLDAFCAASDRLVSVGLTPVDGVDALAVARGLERGARVVRAAQVGLLDEVDRRGFHKADGFASAKVLVRHAANLSDGEALRRARAQRALRDLLAVAAAFRAGRLGACQVDRIARVHANPRVRDLLVDIDADLAVVAARLPYREFDAYLLDWERLADHDGAGDDAQRDHVRRNFRIGTDLNGAVWIDGNLGTLDGAELREVHEHFVEAELHADWADARARLGDAATFDDLPRTEAQRRADALMAIIRAAAANLAARPGGSTIVTNIVMDLATFERHLRTVCSDQPNQDPDPRAATLFADVITSLGTTPDPTHDQHDHAPGTPGTPDTPGTDEGDHTHDDGPADRSPHDPVDATDPAEVEPMPGEGDPVPGTPTDDVPDAFELAPPTPSPKDGTGFRCSTLDGTPVDPAEATANALVGHVRRIVVGTDGVVVDMGRRTRLFTGPRHLAVLIPETTCYWPGCNVPVTHCQADHLDGFNSRTRGPTNPTNAGPACGRHNRLKEHGFTVHRDHHGHWHIHRPDGTEIT